MPATSERGGVGKTVPWSSSAPVLVEHGYLAARAVAGVERDDARAAHGALREQAFRVPGEHADGVRLRALGELGAQLAFEGRGDEALVAVGDGDAQLVGEDARVPDHALFEQRDGGVGVRTHVHPEFAFLLAAVDGEDPVVRDARERFGEAVVRVVDGTLLRVGRLGGERALPSREGAQRRDVLRVVGERFRHDVAGACEHGLGRVVGAARLRIARRQRARVAVGRRLCDHEQRERFEPGVARLRGAGGALLPVRFVQVLHALHDGGFLDLRAQGVRELALLVDGAQHVGLARLERAQVGQPLVQVAQRRRRRGRPWPPCGSAR